MTTSFAGKVVLVTGANSGIGDTAVGLFLAAGARVYGTARREEALADARKRHPGAKWLLADVTDAKSLKTAVESAVREAGRLDVLVNNAGAFVIGPLEASNEEMIRLQFETNVYGVIFASQAALPALKESRGSIVNIGSAAGHKPVAGAAVYGATKAALESLTRSWALELAPAGVRVNLLAPGPTDTPVFEKLGFSAEQTQGVKDAFTKQVPLGRMASREEVSRWIVQLADPGVTWMTGQILSIDGGMSLT